MNLNKILPAIVAASALAFTPTILMAQSALEKGQAYLQENSKKEGVHTTSSGLQYKVVTEGTGKSPKATDTVTVKYRGKLVDGTVFDSSETQPGGTAAFPVNAVIAGWVEGLQLMKEGAKYEFTIPSNLAYGRRGAPGAIGPDETLVFDVELVKIR